MAITVSVQHNGGFLPAVFYCWGGGGEGGRAARLFFFPPCSADHESGIGHRVK